MSEQNCTFQKKRSLYLRLQLKIYLQKLIGETFKEVKTLKIKELAGHAGRFQLLERWKVPTQLLKVRTLIFQNNNFSTVLKIMRLIQIQAVMVVFPHGHLFMRWKMIFAHKINIPIKQLDNLVIIKSALLGIELKISLLSDQRIILSWWKLLLNNPFLLQFVLQVWAGNSTRMAS